MHNNLTPVLDVCCGSRAFWFNKKDTRSTFLDVRNTTIPLPNRNPLEIHPDIMANFQNLPFPDESFYLVVFDPPHVQAAQTGNVLSYYGTLDENWREMLRNGFSECFRVLKPNGTLIFKWAETKISVSEVLKLTPEKPLFGHKSGKLSKTHRMTFTKPNNACSGLAPAGASDSQGASGASR